MERPWEETLRKIRNILEEKRTSGMPVEEEIGLLTGLHLGYSTPELQRKREHSLVGQELKQLLVELMTYCPLTQPCKEHLTDYAFVLFKFGMSTDKVLEAFEEADVGGIGVFERTDYAQYEKSRMEGMFEAYGAPALKIRDAPMFLEWTNEWQKRYGLDREIAAIHDWAKRFSPK